MWWIKQVTLALALVGAAPLAVAETSAHTVVQQSADALMEVVREAGSYVDVDRDRFFRAVEAVLVAVVDFPGIARSVMATHYKDATQGQRERFVEVFKWGLVRAYGQALLEFGDEKIEVLAPGKPPKNPKRQRVKMEVTTTEGKVYPVIYSMVDTDENGWRMRNLVINGVNLGLTYRSQFQSAMKSADHSGDLDLVIEAWGDVIVVVETSET